MRHGRVAGRNGVWAAALSCAALLAACDGPGVGSADGGGEAARLSLTSTLGGADTAGYARALAPRDFDFPEDDGPHPSFRTEWWYITGNLVDETDRRVGFQFTLFRSALAPEAPEAASAWATNQAYMAHLAVTDVEGGKFHAFERFARGANGLAGAQATPFRAWLEDWVLSARTTGGTFPLRLQAAEGGVALDLVMAAGKPRVLQGEAGLSRKGPEPGNASFYYSHTRMPTEGWVTLGADTLHVTGQAWMDREWSTSVLTDGQVGWDWFALQMDDGWDLMVYALRRADGSPHPLSEGVLVDPDGGVRRLSLGEDVGVEVTDRWVSPLDGAVHPGRWRVRVPSRGWNLDVVPVLPDQELDLAFRYWEGAVEVRGVESGVVQGRGYVELTGYAEAPLPSR